MKHFLICLLVGGWLASPFFIHADDTSNNPSLTYQKINTSNVNGIANVTIQLIAKGFPSNLPVNLTIAQMDGYEIHYPEKLLINENHEITSLSKEIRHFNMSNVAQGEPVRYTLWSDDKKWMASVQFTPFPLEVQDKNGHQLSLRIAHPEAQYFRCTATGFSPGEEIIVYSNSESEKKTSSYKVPANGIVEIGVAPAVIGRYGGKASLEIKGITTDNLKINYKWGMEALKPYVQK